jgi:hypothetical protein
LAAGARCRSSLECQEALRCRGAGPTAAGVCGEAKAVGAACSLAVDTLAAYTRADEIDVEHPECVGFCERHRCIPQLALGAACTTSAQCGKANHCAREVCTAAPFGKLGEACTSGGCERGARCVRATCVTPGATGAACESDFDCRGGCVKGDGGVTRCGPRCAAH